MGTGCEGMDSIKMANTGNSLVLFPPKPLSVKWGYRKNCPEELVNARTLRRLSVGVSMWLKRILDFRPRSWTEEEEKQSRLFQQTRHLGWGAEGGQGGSPEKNRRIRGCSKNFPFISLKKKNLFVAFWISIFCHLTAKLGLRKLLRGRADQAAEIEKGGGWLWSGLEGSWHVGEAGLLWGGKDFHSMPCMLPAPQPTPPSPS